MQFEEIGNGVRATLTGASASPFCQTLDTQSLPMASDVVEATSFPALPTAQALALRAEPASRFGASRFDPLCKRISDA